MKTIVLNLKSKSRMLLLFSALVLSSGTKASSQTLTNDASDNFQLYFLAIFTSLFTAFLVFKLLKDSKKQSPEKFQQFRHSRRRLHERKVYRKAA